MKKVAVIGAGFSGMAAASVLAQKGFHVDLFEKHNQAGGRARKFEKSGFTFDMGPSWYWMPDVFEKFYKRFDHTAADFYDLKRLSPSYQVIFEEDKIEIPSDYIELLNLFEKLEKGSSIALNEFLRSAEYKYKVGMTDFVYKPSFSPLEFLDVRLAKSALKLNMFSSISKEIRQKFKNKYIREILEFPVLFLGAKPEDTPALYSLMNYADIKLGTWYPMGGMHQVAQAFQQIATEQGVNFHFNHSVQEFIVKNNSVVGLIANNRAFEGYDIVVSAADYAFTDRLLPINLRNYDDDYWDSRQLSPSSLLFYIGLNKKVENLQHHNLFFDADFSLHAEEIYDEAKWPSNPLFYVSAPSKTDDSVAPEGHENLFLLLPIAPDLEDSDAIHQKYFNIMADRIESFTGTDIRPLIVSKTSFSVKDFKSEYNSLKGNAYGLANTLKQTAFLKPTMKNTKIKNLFYCGQLTVPGPGVPPSIISGQIIGDYIHKKFK